ncbi:hypothetical protein CapIbe_001530 [Capra ibex]
MTLCGYCGLGEAEESTLSKGQPGGARSTSSSRRGLQERMGEESSVSPSKDVKKTEAIVVLREVPFSFAILKNCTE